MPCGGQGYFPSMMFPESHKAARFHVQKLTCNHASADGQFDSDTGVPSGAVHSERLSEKKNVYVSLY